MTEILDVYDLTPMQAGMLFQSLYAPDSAAYLQQYWGRLDGALDAEAFQRAWQTVIDRHDILRSQCHWDGLERPVHVIHDSAVAEWQFEDWSQREGPGLAGWLAADRARGIDPGQAPLMRFALIRLAEDAHCFVWTFHHLLIDGWCGALLVREMLGYYAGAAPLPAPAPFREYVGWRAAQDAGAARAYWTETLAGVEAATPLGIDRTDTGEEGQAEYLVHLDAALSADLAQVARRERLTLNTLLQGAWALVLSRYSGQDDVVFGSVLSGRPADLAGVEEMIGLFLNTVPVRVALGDADTLWPWLRGMQEAQRARETHGHAALSDIQACSGVDAAARLFDSLLIVETYPESIAAAVSRNGAALRLHETGIHERTNFPLTVKVLPGDRIAISLAADATVIPSAALPRLAGHLQQVLTAFATGEDQRLAAISILTAAEETELRRLGQGPQPPEAPAPLARILAAARAHPAAMAVETSGGAAWSYAELEARTATIAAHLRAQGIGRGHVVAVCQDRTPDLLATLIAIWRAGAAYLPLDPTYPAERIAYVLADAGVTLAVTDAVGRRALGATALPVLDIAACGPMAATDLPDDAGGGDLAYILYTSGSTGRPKGVPITHAALANFLDSMLRAPGFTPQDRLLALTTVAFDIAVLELFGPLCAGATLLLADAGTGADGGALARLIAGRQITVMQATPTGWRVLRDSGWQGKPGLRMLVGGEALDSSLARDLLALGGPLWNMYGPTETTIWSAALQVTHGHLHGAKVPVGGPIAHTTLSLHDPAGRRVPIGVPGELSIGGAGLSPGYLGRAHLTAEKFLPDGAGMRYRTGDRARLNPDGTLDFLGRFDDQVKLRGYRIELGEIEARIETHPQVRQAVAMVRDDGTGPRLVVYLRLDGAADLPMPALRAFLGADLPGYMIPSARVVLEAFSQTPNGKIDRKALPVPGAASSPAMAATLRDDMVAGIWANVLQADPRPADSFFDLGGHSLLATRVIGELRRLLGVDLALRDLFEAPVLADFCRRVAERQGIVPLPPIPVSPLPPVLSPAQERQWLIAQLAPESRAYLLPLALRLKGALDTAAFLRAFAAMVQRHAILRCRFPSAGGRPQVVPADPPETLVVEDLTTLPEPARAAALRKAQEGAGSPFDLAAAPPWRARLLRTGAQEHVLLVTLHHILADEWSFGLMLHELSQGYAGESPAMPPIQYSDFAAWQRGLDLSAQRGYWLRQLEGAPVVLDLPTTRPRPAQRGHQAGRVTLCVDTGTAEALRHLAREHGVTLFICLLAAYAAFLHRHSDDTDIIIGTPVSNRQRPEVQGLVGLFVNTLAIRADLAGNPGLSALMAQLRETLLAAHAHQDLPFEQVLDMLHLPRSESHAPLVQTMFAMPDVPQAGSLGPGLTWQALPGQTARARFDLALELSETGHGLSGHFDFATDIFDLATVERLARRFEVLLEGIAGSVDLPVSQLPVLLAAEKTPPVVGRAEAGGPLQWLAIQAAQQPDAPALMGAEVVSFATLHRRVAAGGAALRQAGVAPGSIVALAGDDATIAALLAVWHAGAVAVPWQAGIAVQPAFAIGGAVEGAVTVTLDGEATAAAHPGAAHPGGGAYLVVASDGTALRHSGRLFGHLADALGDIAGADRLAVCATAGTATLAALCAALRAGIALDLRAVAEGVTVLRGETVLRQISLGPELPELPAALVPDGDGLRPAPGVVALLLHRHGQLAPPGAVGELCLGGAALGQGYHGNPSLTADRFRPNPHSAPQDFDPAQGCLFHSGLLARQDADGRLHLVGKQADRRRVAGRGFDPARIEALLAGLPAVAAAALALPGGAGAAERLDIFLEPVAGVILPDEDLLRDHARAHLPDDLQPRSFTWMDRLPRRADGGVDRAALWRLVRMDTGTAPRGPVETQLAAIWCRVLRVDPPGRHDGFFALGGDSILAMQIVAQAAEAGLTLAPQDVFRHQSIAELARVARHATIAAPLPDLPAMDSFDLAGIAGAVSFGDD